jgi:fructokinase
MLLASLTILIQRFYYTDTLRQIKQIEYLSDIMVELIQKENEMAEMVFGSIEAGGTKFMCAVGISPDNILASVRIPTTSPSETLDKAIRFFKEQSSINPIAAVGIASFGPVDLDPSSKTYGYITSTPKPGWANTNFAAAVKQALNIPVGLDTDVNGAALGEYTWGAARGLHTFVYITVGTGIGGGGMAGGQLLHGMAHPEMGHIRIPHDPARDPFPGACPYHGDCLEGLASGKAVELRWGVSPEKLQADHPAWELEAEYLSYGIINIMNILSPQRIIIGGGLIKQPALLPAVRKKVSKLIGGYLYTSDLIADMDSYLVPPRLGDRSGILGGIALAKQIVETKSV